MTIEKITLNTLLTTNGYEIIKSNYFMCILFPLCILSRFKEKGMRLFGRKQTIVKIGRVPFILNRILQKILYIESLLSERLTFPIGLWYFVLPQDFVSDVFYLLQQARNSEALHKTVPS